MNQEQIIQEVAAIISTPEDIAALKSLIEERKILTELRAVEAEFYAKKGGMKS